MAKHTNPPGIHLPRGWPRHVKSAILHVIAFAQYAAAYSRSWAINGRIAHVQLKADNDEFRQQVAMLTEGIRIKDTRTKRLAPQKRPHYVPTERFAILELRAAQAWSVQKTAGTFLVTAATIASWMKRVDENGADPFEVTLALMRCRFVSGRTAHATAQRSVDRDTHRSELPGTSRSDEKLNHAEFFHLIAAFGGA